MRASHGATATRGERSSTTARSYFPALSVREKRQTFFQPYRPGVPNAPQSRISSASGMPPVSSVYHLPTANVMCAPGYPRLIAASAGVENRMSP